MSIQHLINPASGDKLLDISATLNELKVHAIRIAGSDASIQFQAGNITCTAAKIADGSYTLTYTGAALAHMPVITCTPLSSGNLLTAGITSASATTCQLYVINTLTQAYAAPTSLHIQLQGN